MLLFYILCPTKSSLHLFLSKHFFYLFLLQVCIFYAHVLSTFKSYTVQEHKANWRFSLLCLWSRVRLNIHIFSKTSWKEHDQFLYFLFFFVVAQHKPLYLDWTQCWFLFFFFKFLQSSDIFIVSFSLPLLSQYTLFGRK